METFTAFLKKIIIHALIIERLDQFDLNTVKIPYRHARFYRMPLPLFEDLSTRLVRGAQQELLKRWDAHCQPMFDRPVDIADDDADLLNALCPYAHPITPFMTNVVQNLCF
jgi:hypothetical protein